METYKNVLANKFMRDTNYIIIKDTDDLEELERQWELFNSQLTMRQQRLSDDRSIEIWNMTNMQHYESLKTELMESLDSELGDTDDLDKQSITYDPEDDEEVEDDDITDNILNSDLDFELPDDENNISEPVKEESEIPTDGKVDHPIQVSLDISSNIQKDNEADQYEIDTNINIIGRINATKDDADNYLSNLEKAFNDFNAQSNHHKRISDDKCRQLYGMSNLERYNKLKADALKNKRVKTKDEIKATDDEKLSSAPVESLGEFVSQVYNDMKLINESESISVSKHRRFNDTPYFTPNELIDMGVHGNHNYYSKNADNDGLITKVKVSTWFDSYKDMCMDHIFEDYRKDWIDTLDILYSDFYDIKDEDKILARKQSILDLGWNPEIPFNKKNRLKASKRVSKIIDSTVPKDIFINLDSIVDNEDLIEEAVTTDTHKPVYLIFVKGKSPIISSGIKFFTKSDYSHSGISFDSDLETIYSYNMVPTSGMVKENFTGYKDADITVMAFYAPNETIDNMKSKIKDFESNKTSYDFTVFIDKVFKRTTRFVKDSYKQVCSTFVDVVLQSGKVFLPGETDIPDPGQLYQGAKAFPNKIIEVYDGPANKYNSKKTNGKMKTLVKKYNLMGIEESVIFTEAQLPSGVTLRNATKDDTDNMFKWEIESVDKEIRNDAKVIEHIQKDVQDSIKNTKMIMYKNETIGMITTCQLDGGKYWYIGEIYILHKYRGKGIGTVLLENEIDKHDRLKLQVAQSNTKAKKLYESLGFEVTEKNDKNKMYVMTLDKTSKNESVEYLEESKQRKNDKGKPIPEKCPKCDSKIGVFFHGEPVYKCVNKECGKFFGVVPFHEHTSILNEVKKFPIEFDKEGNLIIYKSRVNSLAFGDEIDDSVQLLESYRNTSNIDGMKYELAKLWYINDCIEKKLKKKLTNDKYKELIDTRATCLNVFKSNLDYVLKAEKGFNFSDYYNSTPFSDNSTKVTSNTLKYAAKAVASII